MTRREKQQIENELGIIFELLTFFGGLEMQDECDNSRSLGDGAMHDDYNDAYNT